MGTEQQTGGNKPNQTNPPGQGKPNPQQGQRKEHENPAGGSDKGSGHQRDTGEMRSDR